MRLGREEFEVRQFHQQARQEYAPNLRLTLRMCRARSSLARYRHWNSGDVLRRHASRYRGHAQSRFVARLQRISADVVSTAGVVTYTAWAMKALPPVRSVVSKFSIAADDVTDLPNAIAITRSDGGDHVRKSQFWLRLRPIDSC